MIFTFDIWLEDSQGRQFRRSNHYQHPIGLTATFRLYMRMAYLLGSFVIVRTKVFD